MEDALLDLIQARSGHFVFESGHHGDLWLDLELLCQYPDRVRPMANELARQLSDYDVDVVCGPLIEGSFVGLMVAESLSIEFTYTEPTEARREELFPVDYSLPVPQRARVENKRVAIVNDVINAGSAVQGTYRELLSHGGQVVVVATLLTLGNSAAALAREWDIELLTLANRESHLWLPEECPFCQTGDGIG